MRYSASDLRNPDMALLRRLQRKVEVDNEKRFFENQNIFRRNEDKVKKNELIKMRNQERKSQFLNGLGNLLEDEPLLELEKPLKYKKPIKLKLLEKRVRGRR